MKHKGINYAYYTEYIISMRKFLEEFVYPTVDFISSQDTVREGKLNLSKKQDDLIDNINHWDLADLDIPYIKRVPDSTVKREDVLSGKILLVESTGMKHMGKVVCAYVRPFNMVYCNESMQKIADTKRLSRKKR